MTIFFATNNNGPIVASIIGGIFLIINTIITIILSRRIDRARKEREREREKRKKPNKRRGDL